MQLALQGKRRHNQGRAASYLKVGIVTIKVGPITQALTSQVLCSLSLARYGATLLNGTAR